MRILTLETDVILPATLSEVFDFFSNAENLQKITPPWLDFKILTPTPILIRAGTLIDYSLKWRGISLKWKTEITDWQPGKSFTDKQIKGPYKLWEHKHLFESTENGTKCVDKLRYAAPFQPFSIPIVKHDVKTIFDYRKSVIQKLFSR